MKENANDKIQRAVRAFSDPIQKKAKSSHYVENNFTSMNWRMDHSLQDLTFENLDVTNPFWSGMLFCLCSKHEFWWDKSSHYCSEKLLLKRKGRADRFTSYV